MASKHTASSPSNELELTAIKAPTKEGARPFLRWAGSKRKILPTLSEYWNPSFERYVEPFMGSACLYFHLRPPKSLLGDINQELIDCFTTVREHPKSVHEELSLLQLGKDFYYQIRSLDPTQLSQPQKAARLIYLTRFCFNGLYRTNRNGQFNVPYGGDRSGQLPTLTELTNISDELKNADLMCADFSKTIEQVRKNDFVYLDPPYWAEGRRRINQYGPKTFYREDLQRLELALKTIDKKKAYFVLSYEDCDEARLLTSKWKVKTISVRRNVAGFAKHRRVENEMIATNI